MSVLVRGSLEEDILSVAAKLRREDSIEVLAQGYATPQQAITESFRASTIRFTLEKDGEPIAMFGLVPDSILGDKAAVWLLGTDDIATVKKSFCEFSRKVIKYFVGQYPILFAQVDGRYAKTHRWLEWLGAKKGAEYRLGGAVFNDFYFVKGA